MSPDGFQPFHFHTNDGLKLHGRDYSGTGDPIPVVCLAGLSRNSRDFHQIALLISAEGRRVITLDYRGRGLSDRDSNPANYNIIREAQDVIQALTHLGIAEANFIGTSRGGLILHFLPAMAPGLVRSIILNDVGPVIEPDGLRAIRDYLSARATPADFEIAARALKLTHSEEFPILEDRDWSDMAEALFRRVDDQIVADFDPALVEPLKVMDLDKPLPDLWQQYDALGNIPLMIIRGENSKLLSEETVAAMIARRTACEYIIAGGQGHAPILHLGDLPVAIGRFLKSV